MEPHEIVSRNEWLVARKAFLAQEKEFTRLRDQLAAARRALPWVKVEKQYVFDGLDGRQTLAELFAGRSQLIIKHFMLPPGQKSPCVGCSFEVDHVDGILVHLEHNDVSYVVVARAPIAEIEAVRQRMGWRFKWVSSFSSDFNYDFHVSFTKDELAKGEAVLQLSDGGGIPRRPFRKKRVLQGRERRHLSYLFVIRTRRRGPACRIQISRYHAEGPQ